MPSHYLNQCWNIIDWTIKNKLQWNFNRYAYFFIQRNAFENVFCEKVAIRSRERWVNTEWHYVLKAVRHQKSFVNSSQCYMSSRMLNACGEDLQLRAPLGHHQGVGRWTDRYWGPAQYPSGQGGWGLKNTIFICPPSLASGTSWHTRSSYEVTSCSCGFCNLYILGHWPID